MTKDLEEEIRKAVEVLRSSGAQEVYIFGSAAEGTDAPGSDIDLAVKGLAPEAFFETVGRVAMAIMRPFDLVDMDDPSPFTEYLQKKGKLLRVA